jgi:hypothetical protein
MEFVGFMLTIAWTAGFLVLGLPAGKTMAGLAMTCTYTSPLFSSLVLATSNDPFSRALHVGLDGQLLGNLRTRKLVLPRRKANAAMRGRTPSLGEGQGELW